MKTQIAIMIMALLILTGCEEQTPIIINTPTGAVSAIGGSNSSTIINNITNNITTINNLTQSINITNNITNNLSSSAGGTNRELQFNNNSAFSGTDKLIISPHGFLNLQNPDNSNPTVNPNNGMILYTHKRGAETVLTYISPTGYDRIVQPHISYENSAWYVPAESGTASAVPLAIGFTPVAPVGTVTSPIQTGTTFPLSIERTRFTGVASAVGGLVELKGSVTKYYRGNSSWPHDNGGFKLVMRYSPVGVERNVTGCFGMTASVVAYTNTSNCFVGASAINSIFAGFNFSENLTYYIANATQLRKVYSCNGNYPVNNSNVFFETTIFAQPKAGNISIYTIRLDNNNTPPCVWESYGNNVSLPHPTTPLTFRMYMGRTGINGTSLGTQTIMDFNKLYLASDN